MHINELKSYTPKNIFAIKNRPILYKSNFNVGEHLPPLQANESEIVRLSLGSTTGDIISIRLKRSNDDLIISVVDEYDMQISGFKDKYNSTPNQGEILDIIINSAIEKEGQSLIINIIKSNQLDSIEKIFEFIKIDSAAFPNINELLEDYLKDLDY